jgi:hypothetical protein
MATLRVIQQARPLRVRMQERRATASRQSSRACGWNTAARNPDAPLAAALSLDQVDVPAALRQPLGDGASGGGADHQRTSVRPARASGGRGASARHEAADSISLGARSGRRSSSKPADESASRTLRATLQVNVAPGAASRASALATRGGRISGSVRRKAIQVERVGARGCRRQGRVGGRA